MAKGLLTGCVITVLLSLPVRAEWIAAQKGQLPAKTIVAGQDRNGQPFYVCRAQYEGGVYPGTLAGASRTCNISYDGREYALSDYEVLVGDGYSWAPAYNGEIPFDAYSAGKNRKGEFLYICRGEVNSEIRPGSIYKSYGGCSVPYVGKELKALWYEVLVETS